MTEITLNGPVVKDGIHNIVLRDARFHSPIQRLASSDSYHVISIGIREGEYTSWVGDWDQSTQTIEGASPSSILDTNRLGMRLKANQAVVVKVVTTGVPQSLEGSRINFQLARVGGHDGPSKPLVTASALVADKNSQVAVAAVEKQINDGGLSEWDESVQLHDPVGLVVTGTFGGRIQWDSTTQISLQRYTGNWVEVNGEAVSITSSGLSVLSTDTLLTSGGTVGSTAPSLSTLYYVYVGQDQIRLSATAPSAYLGSYYLGTVTGATDWRFCGWVYLNGSTQFTDGDTAREVINYYNRERLRLFSCPGYTDDNAWTTYVQSTATWAKVNAGGGSDVTFIANGEDVVSLCATMRATLDVVGSTYGTAVSIDGITDIETSGHGNNTGIEAVHLTVPREYEPGIAGHHTASLVGRQGAGTATIVADSARNGAVVDPAETFLSGVVMG